jgi:hypothetical protein
MQAARNMVPLSLEWSPSPAHVERRTTLDPNQAAQRE